MSAIRIPRQSTAKHIIERPRLAALIDDGAASAMCVLRAATNSGKSIAINQWAVRTNRAIAWLNLNDQELSAEVFWRQLLAGAAPFTLIIENYYLVKDGRISHDLARLLKLSPELSLLIATVTSMAYKETLTLRDTTLDPSMTSMLTTALHLDHLDVALIRALLPEADFEVAVLKLTELGMLTSFINPPGHQLPIPAHLQGSPHDVVGAGDGGIAPTRAGHRLQF